MNQKLIAITLLLLISVPAVAARVESDEAQTYGAKANATRKVVVGAGPASDGGKCDFGQPATNQSTHIETNEILWRAVCNQG